MSDRLIGAHMPTSCGFADAAKNLCKIGGNALQVFTTSPRQWNCPQINEEKASAFHVSCGDLELKSLVAHDSYLINLAAPDEAILNKSIHAFIGEMNRCHDLKIPYVVTHMGSHMTKGDEWGLEKLGESVQKVLSETHDDTCITLETTAGQGTNLGYKFEHLAYVIEACKADPRVVVCMDTCHIFAAGYPIHTPEGYEKTIKEFDKIIGLDRLKVIHTNDSLKPFESRRDRHAHIGEGEIGLEPFRWIVNDKRLAHAPMILETPGVERYEEEIKLLKSLIA